MPGRVTVPKWGEFELRPWTPYLKVAPANGVQYTSSFNGNADGTWFGADTLVNSDIIPRDYACGQGLLKQLEYGVTVGFRVDNGDSEVNWKVQGKNVNAMMKGSVVSWVDLSDSLTQARPCNAAFGQDWSLGGYAPIGANINTVPFEFRVVFNANTADAVQMRVKNSSYVRYVYTAT